MRIRNLLVLALVAGTVGIPAGAHAAGRGPTLDTSFGVRGAAVADFGGGDEVTDLLLQPDGRMVAVGPGDGFVNLVRYLPDGSPDDSFGTWSRVSSDIDPDSFWDWPVAAALRPDGRIVVAASVSRAGRYQPAVATFAADGTLESTALPDLDAESNMRVADAVFLPDGSTVLAIESSTTDGSAPLALAKLRADNTLDPGFGDAGLVRLDLGPDEFDFVTAIAVAPDGDLVLAGATGAYYGLPEPSTDLLLVRFSATGALDRSFGTGGRVVRDLTGRQGIDGAAGLTVAPSGRIVLTTWSQVGEERRNGLLRFLPNGRPDRSFGRAGVAAGPTGVSLNTPTLVRDGRILTTGSDSGDVALTRFRSDGSLDRRFGTGGVVRADVDGRTENGNVLRIDAAGRIVVGGNSGGEGSTSFGVFRFLP